MKSILFILAARIFWISYCTADTSDPYVGEWSYAHGDVKHADSEDRRYTQGVDFKLCMKLTAGIRLDIQYETRSGASNIATISSTDQTFVDSERCQCVNGTTDIEQTLALNFGILTNQTLLLTFTRDPNNTNDDSKNRWQLSKVQFDFMCDPFNFPGSKAITMPPTMDSSKTNQSLTGGMSTSIDRSYSCSQTGTIVVNDRFNITFTNLRVQAFMSGRDFSTADHCAIDQQETTGLIPIIIGASLAALVIIVLVACLIRRERAKYAGLPII